MLKRVCAVLVFFGLVFSTAAAFAQDAPSGRWWRSPRVAKELKLTPGEKQRLDDAYRDHRRRVIRKKSRVEAERFELENLMERPKIDEKAIRAQNRKLEESRSDLADETLGMVIEIRKTIGAERWNRLHDIYRSGKGRKPKRK